MKLTKTGIAGLDEFLTGGLPPRILLLTGSPGSGNEVFARQVAYYQAKLERVTYFTVNRTADSVKEEMATYNWDISPLLGSENWKFKTLTKAVDAKREVIEEMGQKRTVIIDSLSELLLINKLEAVIDLVTAMLRQNHNGDRYHLLLMVEGMQDSKAEIMMQHFSEGVIVFNTVWTSDNAQKEIFIKKMKDTFVPSRKLSYSIGKKGFVIETATRIT